MVTGPLTVDLDWLCATPGTIGLALKSIKKFSFGHHGSSSFTHRADDTRIQERRLLQALPVIAAAV
jgi:hypothetical protein